MVPHPTQVLLNLLQPQCLHSSMVNNIIQILLYVPIFTGYCQLSPETSSHMTLTIPTSILIRLPSLVRMAGMIGMVCSKVSDEL